MSNKGKYLLAREYIYTRINEGLINKRIFTIKEIYLMDIDHRKLLSVG